MRVVINKNVLQDCLKVLSSSVQKDGEITSSILFKVEEGKLTMKASNNQVYTNIVLTTEDGVEETKGEGVFAVKESRLSKWISNVLDDSIEVGLNGDQVTFKCGSVESPFPSIKDHNQFPSKRFETAYDTSEVISEVSVGTILQSLGFVSPMVSDSISNSDPTGKLKVAQVRDGQLFGTDAKLMALYCCPKLDTGWKIGQEQISPARTYLKRQDDDFQIKIRATDTVFFFEVAPGSFFGFSKQRHDLPVFNGIPDTLVEDDVWSLDKDHLKQAIGALLATADENDKYLKIKVKGTGDTANLLLSMRTYAERKNATVTVPCNRSRGTEDLEFSAAHPLLTKALGSFDEDFHLAYSPQEKYLKFYEETLEGDTKICLMTLREDIVL